MAQGVFTIEEQVGTSTAILSTDVQEAARFDWTADPITSSTMGGAKACPQGSWEMGGQLTRSRTEYPGALVPSEQVLGSSSKDFTFSGCFWDRYNMPGYAVSEMRRFEEMCQRGNLIHFSYQRQKYEGLVVDWTFNYRHEAEIEYKFTVSVHARLDDARWAVGEFTTPHAGPGGESTQEEALAALDRWLGPVVDAQDTMPRNSFYDDLANRIDTALTSLADARNAAAGTVANAPGVDKLGRYLPTVNQWRRLETQFREVESHASDLCDAMADVRTDLVLGYLSVDNFFATEKWSRFTRNNARMVMGEANAGWQAMKGRSAPTPSRTYQAAAGESLYAIAQRFYGDPMSWTFIANQNHLSSPVLTDGTTLVLPPLVLS